MKNQTIIITLLMSVIIILVGCNNDTELSNEESNNIEIEKSDTSVITENSTSENLKVQQVNTPSINPQFESFEIGVMNVLDTYDVLWEEFEKISPLISTYPNVYSQDLIDLSMEHQFLSNSVLEDIPYRQFDFMIWDRIKLELLYPLQEVGQHRGNALYGLMRTTTGKEDASASVKEQMELSKQKLKMAIDNFKKLEEELKYFK